MKRSGKLLKVVPCNAFVSATQLHAQGGVMQIMRGDGLVGSDSA
jgi:hypothetical protein